MADKKDCLRVGVIVTTHGIRGEVKVFPTTDDAERFRDLKMCFVDARRSLIPLEVRSVKFFKQFVILGFKDYDNINDVLEFVKRDLLVERKDAVELKPGEYFICDLVGHKVLSDTGEELGVLKDVITSSANNVYVVKRPEGKDLLIPVIPECVLGHDMEKGVTTVHLLDGLLDL